MRTLLWPGFACAACLFLLLSTGCAVGVGAYGYDEGPGYYEAYGGGPVGYGGWASGYRVGPVRDGDHRDERGGGPSARVAAPRGGPAPRSAPSIPSGARGGGGGRH